MQEQIFDEKNGLWYELHGDYYLPCLAVPPEEMRHIGVWGWRHLQYLRQHRKALYTELSVLYFQFGRSIKREQNTCYS